jgi:hypothetical protein
MEQEFHGEWRRLEEEATAILKRLPERDGVLPECHAVMLPSFEDCRSYTILVPALNSSIPTLGVRRVWRRRSDLAKFEAPIIRLRYGPKLQPAIDEEEVVLARDVADGILERAASVRVPACIRERTVGADGESYVLSFGSLFVSTRFEWWSHTPEGWDPLEVLLRDIARVVESGLTSRPTRN